MNKVEARAVAKQEIARYTAKSFLELRRLLDEVDAYGAKAPSGSPYEVEVHAFWDNKPEGDIRVFCEVSSDFWSSIFPLCEDFIISPDGTLRE